MTKWKMTDVRTILHIILQNSKTLSTVIEQCTTKDNTSRLQCLWLKWYIFTKVKWPFLRPIHSQTQNLLLRYIRLLEQDWNITSNNIVNSYFFLFFAKDLFSRSQPCRRLSGKRFWVLSICNSARTFDNLLPHSAPWTC